MTRLELVEVKPGSRWPVSSLKQILKKPIHAVKFAALQQLNAVQLGALLRLLFPDVTIVQALTMEAGQHSGSLQSYIVELGYENYITEGEPSTADLEAMAEEDRLLAEMFEYLEVKVADEITDVMDTITDAMTAMPGKQGRLQMKTLLKADRRIKRKLGVHEAGVHHARVPDNLVVFDTSGSMGEPTVEKIVTPVVALAVEANAHLVIVSDTARHWGPGEFSVESVLNEAEYGGTHYETLAPIFDRDWGVVVTIADYDSSWSAKDALSQVPGRIKLLLDVSLVERPTFLAECLDQLADEARPLMVAKYSMTHAY